MMKKYVLGMVAVVLAYANALAQFPVSINATNVAITQNFDSLGRSGTIDSVLVPGWQFLEVGMGSVNRTYGINDGASNTGNTYSYGIVNNTDRAWGSVASAGVQSILGAYYINNTGSVVTGIQVQFTMEQWRSGGRTTADSSEFFYGINNGGFGAANGTWTKNSALNLISKIVGNPAPTAGSRNGNDTANQTLYNVTISGLSVQVGDTIYLRWRDQDASGADDGLAIDNFSITAFAGGGMPNPTPVSSLTFTTPNSNSGTISFTRTGYNAAGMSTLVFMKPSAAVVQGTPTRNSDFYTAETNFSLATSRYENDSLARCVYNGDGLSFNVTGLQPNTRYHVLTYVVRNSDSVYSTASITNNATLGNPFAANNLQFLAESQNSATLSWNKPNDYNNTTHTTLVFVKSGNAAINSGSPSAAADTYTADANFLGNGSRLDVDTNAVCVYKGDANTILVNGLARNSAYRFVVFSYRESDNLYSNGTQASGNTLDKNIPAALTSLSFTQITATSATINWTKPTNYSNDSMQIVVFVKRGSAIQDTNTHQVAVSSYTATNDFSIATSNYEHDSNAKCVYNGDGNSVNITGLTTQTTYFVNAYVVNIFDTGYSNPRTNTFTTPAPPAPAIPAADSIRFTQTALRTARISWKKPVEYLNGSFTTLVFVKQDSAITTGTINRSANRYFASTVIGNGTRYDFDSSAYCVFRADTNVVNLVNLQADAQYHIVVHFVRDADSVATTPATGVGTMQLPALRNIGAINSTNLTTGVPDSSGLFVQLQGTVIGFNQRLNGLQFLLSDATGGITIFNTNRNFGYTVAEGDSVYAIGTVGTNRGLCQLTIDSVWRGGRSTRVITATDVTALNENTENKLVKLTSAVRFLAPPTGGNWPTATTNIAVITQNLDTLILRLLSFSDLAGKPLPTSSTFFVTGMGAQQSTSNFAPFAFNGYYIIPRNEADITNGGELGAFNLVAPTPGEIITLSEPLTDVVTFSWNTSRHSGPISAPSYRVEFDTITGDFSVPLGAFESDNTGSDTTFTTDKENILDFLLMLGYTPGQTVNGQWRVVATSGLVVKNSTQNQPLQLVIPFSSSLNENKLEQSLKVYPNPATAFVNIVTTEPIEHISIYSLTGKLIKTYPAQPAIDIREYNKGIYLMQIRSAQGETSTRKLVIH